jgi:hypothetical protein
MNRIFRLASLAVVGLMMTASSVELAEAGGWHRAYGRGYYAGYYGGVPGYNYSTAYRGEANSYLYSSVGWGYGAGYGGWGTTTYPYYHRGSLYSGGYRPSYSYGIYNPLPYAAPVGYQASYAPYGYSTVSSGYDYAPYVVTPLSTINTAPTYNASYSGVPYGAFGYSACGCR